MQRHNRSDSLLSFESEKVSATGKVEVSGKRIQTRKQAVYHKPKTHAGRQTKRSMTDTLDNVSWQGAVYIPGG